MFIDISVFIFVYVRFRCSNLLFIYHACVLSTALNILAQAEKKSPQLHGCFSDFLGIANTMKSPSLELRVVGMCAFTTFLFCAHMSTSIWSLFKHLACQICDKSFFESTHDHFIGCSPFTSILNDALPSYLSICLSMYDSLHSLGFAFSFVSFLRFRSASEWCDRVPDDGEDDTWGAQPPHAGHRIALSILVRR